MAFCEPSGDQRVYCGAVIVLYDIALLVDFRGLREFGD